MTRGNPGVLQPFDPEIDRTFHRLVRHSRSLSLESIPLDSVSLNNSEHSPSESANFNSVLIAPVTDSDHSDFIHFENNMAQPPPRERTLRELAAPDFTYESLCIQYPDEDVPYVLKTGLIHLLPKFHGLAGECPHKHLKEFHIVCSTMKPPDVLEDHIFLKAFPHSLEGVAKDWLYYLAPRSISSWNDLKRMFLEKYFPASRTTAIRKDISGIRQLGAETLYEYWERFKKLCASCPHHQISEQLLLQYFYEGLNSMERSMIDAASGGALGDMTPAEARQLIEKMASNSQQFSARSDAIVIRGVHDVAAESSTDRKLESKLDALVTLVTQLAVNQKSASVARVCGICTSNDHHTDSCPSLQQPVGHNAHSPQPMLRTSTIIDHNSSKMMTCPATGTIQVGEITQILDGQTLHSSSTNNSHHLLYRTLLVRVDLTCLHLCSSIRDSSMRQHRQPLNLLLLNLQWRSWSGR